MEVLVGKCGGELKGLFVCVHWWGGEVGEVRGGERLWFCGCLSVWWLTGGKREGGGKEEAVHHHFVGKTVSSRERKRDREDGESVLHYSSLSHQTPSFSAGISEVNDGGRGAF